MKKEKTTALMALVMQACAVAPLLCATIEARAAGGAALPTDTIQWGACPPPAGQIPDAGQQCATLHLPLDHRNPEGATIDVAISRVKAARPDLRRGVLLTNPGGPGGSGLDMPRILTVLAPQAVLDRYDIIGFDPRGIGLSRPVTCGLTPQEVTDAYVPLEQAGGFSATANFARDVADRCARLSGDVLPYITTANTARDMDRIREALGEAKISYFAYSYGTYLGGVYASLFPARTDRFVLDSSVHPGWVWRAQFRSWGLADNVRFPDFAKFVAANDATYHLGKTAADVRTTYFRLSSRLYSQPMTLPDGTQLNGPFFRELSFSGLYNDADFPGTAALWQTVNETPADAAAVQAALAGLRLDGKLDGVPADNMAAGGLAVACDDAAWPRSVTEYQIGFNADRTLFPIFGALGSNIWACAFWHNQPMEPLVPISSSGPAKNILVVQNLRDPATPYPGGVEMRRKLGDRARLVTVDQGGHAVYGLSTNTCANDTITAFLAQGTYPGSDAFCPADATAVQTARRAELQSAGRDKAIKELRRRMGPPVIR